MNSINKHTSSNLNKYQCRHSFAINRITAFSEKLAEMVTHVKHARILNLGCGEGFDINNLFKNKLIEFHYACGLDRNLSSLKFSRDIITDFRFDVVNGDLQSLPLRFSSFDLILCLEVLEHLRDPSTVLHEISHQFDGYCLFSVPNEPAYRLTRMLLLRQNILQCGNHPEHLHNWSKKTFCRFIGDYFVVDNVSITFPWTIALCHRR